MGKRLFLSFIMVMMAFVGMNYAPVKAETAAVGPMSKVPFMTQVAAQSDDPCYAEGADIHGHNNCGPASVAMAIASRGGSTSVEMVASAMRGAGLACNQDYTNPFGGSNEGIRLEAFLNERGLTRVAVNSIDTMKDKLRAGYAVVVLINNAELIKIQAYGTLTITPADHIVVVTGYNDSGFFINDPLRNSTYVTEPLENYLVSNEVFTKITSEFNSSDNRFSAMVIEDKVEIPAITYPSNGHVFRDAWSFTWNNASDTNFFKICRDGNDAACVVYERRSGGSYQSTSASWAKQQTGKWCATVGVTENGPWSSKVCFTMNAPRITSPTANQQVRGFWQVNWVGDASYLQMCDSSFSSCLVNQPVSGGVYRAQNEAWARIQRGNYCARVGASRNGPWSDVVCFNVDNTVMIGGGLFRISVAGSNRSLDVKDRKDKNGTITQIYEFTGKGGSNQKWRFDYRGDGFYAIRPSSSFSNRCLDVSGNSTDNGRNLQIWNCHYGANQQFRVVDMGGGRYVIVARHSGKVLDVKGARIKNGTDVHQWDIHGQSNQLWELVPVR